MDLIDMLLERMRSAGDDKEAVVELLSAALVRASSREERRRDEKILEALEGVKEQLKHLNALYTIQIQLAGLDIPTEREKSEVKGGGSHVPGPPDSYFQRR